ncbi:MAG: FAD-binding protein [Coriobacteriia bacterium]|nr:FAD-binding protein [Coriobacteriia bacterium]
MAEKNCGVSRRNFLKGLGAAGTLGALTALGAGSVANAAETKSAEGTATTRLVKTKTGYPDQNPDWLGEAPQIDESLITETIDTEVLVVGYATGGMPAVAAAVEEGAKVYVVDRQGAPFAMKEDIGVVDSKMQKAYYKEHPEFKIDHKEILEDLVRYANGYVSYDLIKVWINESGAYMDWYQKILEKSGKWHLEYEAGLGTEDGQRDRAWATGHSPQKNDPADENCPSIEDVFKEYIESFNLATYRWNAFFTKLEQDETGRVTGAICRDELTDQYFRVNASKGVILATGGYSNDVNMMKAMQPEILDVKIACDGSGSKSTSQGIKAAMWVGARKDPVGTSMLFNRACCKPTDTCGHGTPGRWFWFGEQPNLKVNLNGERFCNESGPYDYMLHAAYMQPQHTYCTIWDKNYAKYAEQFDEVGCCRLFPFPNGAKNNIPLQVVEGMLDGLMADGYVVKANSLEELAEGLGIPADKFVAQVKKYNKYAKDGHDPDYYKEPHRITPVDTPPFYGARTGAWHLTTLDGVMINTDMQVLDQNNEPIPGLFATGDCSGGFFSTSYPNLATGVACGRTMTFGRHAGKYVANL